jgi:4-hydroxybenzoate polyprenyltransferase/phosphoserine phosphatase
MERIRQRDVVDDTIPDSPPMRPLCVDLDGTLIRTDTLIECTLRLVKNQPREALRIPAWLLRGRARLKREIASRVRLDVTTLPYHAPFLDFLRAERASGRSLVLVSAADEAIVRDVADHLGLFDEVIGSDGATNLKGEGKRAALRARFQAGGYDYAGNDASDVAVWEDAHQAIAVNAPPRVVRRSKAPMARVFARERTSLRVVRKALRLQHWVKNLLIFVPIVMAHQLQNVPLVLASVLAFLSFGMCASAIYLINDLFDLDADRRHPTKRHRPLASGALSLQRGMMLAPLLLLASIGIATFMAPAFMVTLLTYVVLTLSYSWRIKAIAILDVVVLAGLYTIRVIAGSAATGVPPSPWLLAFSLFFFFSLAMVKRYSELDALGQSGDESKGTRGYYASDRPEIASLGSASGYIAVLVLALYINSDAVVVLYRQPLVLWLISPLLLYWISRVWLLAHRGEMHEDPVVFAIRDRVSYAVGIGVAVILFAAATGALGRWSPTAPPPAHSVQQSAPPLH